MRRLTDSDGGWVCVCGGKIGSIIVDDSFPVGYSSKKALRRIRAQRDIVVTTAGALYDPQCDIRYTPVERRPDETARRLQAAGLKAIFPTAHAITGCVFSALFTRRFGVPAVVGPVTAEDALATYRTLRRHGVEGTRLYVIDVPGEGGVVFDGARDYDHQHNHRRLAARF